MLFKKILVPYDGSKPSDHALEQAIELAKLVKSNNNKDTTNDNNDVHVILLYVCQEIIVPAMIERPMRSPKTGEVTTVSELIKDLNEEVRTNMSKTLDEKKHKYAVKDDVIIETMSLVGGGPPADNIVDFANDQKVDLIVIGNVGLSGLSKVKALGSVSRSVSERASCPVLIVH
jgi:nucleotide-binding universal stress UspA family protein